MGLCRVVMVCGVRWSGDGVCGMTGFCWELCGGSCLPLDKACVTSYPAALSLP